MRKATAFGVAAVTVGGTAALSIYKNRKNRRRPHHAVSLRLITPDDTAPSVMPCGYRPRPFRTVHTIIATYGMVTLGQAANFNDLTDFNRAWGSGLRYTFGAITGFVTDIIVGGLATILENVWEVMGKSFRFVWDHTDWLFDQAWSGIGNLAGRIASLENIVPGVVRDFVNFAIDTALGPLRWVLQQVPEMWSILQRLTLTLWDQVWNIVDAFFESVIMPLLAPLLGIADEIRDMVTDLIGELLGQIESIVWDLLHTSADLCMFIVDFGLSTAVGLTGGALEVVRGAWSFLTWVAEHPVDVMENLVMDALRNILEANYEIGRSIINDNRSEIEQLVASLLGIRL